MHNLVVMFPFSIFLEEGRGVGGGINLDQKIKIVSSSWMLKFGTQTNLNMLISMIMFTFSVLDRKSFLDKFHPKNKNCQFKAKFGTQSNSNIRNSMVLLTFLIFDRKCSFFWERLGSKNENCQFKQKFGTQTNWSMCRIQWQHHLLNAISSY